MKLAPGASSRRTNERGPIVAGFVIACALGVVVTLGGCSGGDDASSTTPVVTAATTLAPVATAAPVITTPVITEPADVVYITEGATVLVANASRINGAAGRMAGRIGAVGYLTVPSANSTEGQLSVTKIYYDPSNVAAKAVADSLRLAFGAGEMTVIELPSPPPIDTGDMAGAAVLVAMGNDIADKTLDEMQGKVDPAAATSSTGG